MIFLGLCCGGCDSAAKQPVGYDFPAVPPIWIVEDDPKATIFDRKDLDRDRKIGKMLVIPVYMGYRHGDGTDRLAIAHPFVYTQGGEIEEQLSSFGQRESLRALTIWVPGYFPGSIGRIFPWVPVINGKRMIVLELQPCVGSEKRQLDAAMKALLEGDITIVERISPKRPSPPYTDELGTTDEPYDASRVVHSNGYDGRFFYRGWPRNTHVLWAFDPETRVLNRLSAEDMKIVAAFASHAME
jgi:hypothetical protein